MLGRVAAERRKPVEGDSAAHGVEARLGQGERRSTVSQMSGNALEPARYLAKALDLVQGIALVVLLGGCEMAHYSDDAVAGKRPRLVDAHPPPAHTGVDLQMQVNA
jgi:hypothetical protein